MSNDSWTMQGLRFGWALAERRGEAKFYWQSGISSEDFCSGYEWTMQEAQTAALDALADLLQEQINNASESLVLVNSLRGTK